MEWQQLQIFKSEGISWDKDLPAIQLALNLQKLDELKTSPFQLLHGWLLCPTSFVSDLYDTDEVYAELKSKSEWSKAISVKMARAISDHYITDQRIKAKRSVKLDDAQQNLKIGTRVLRLYKQPPGACAKLFVNWKGVFVIRKQVDVDTYLISLEDDGRKKFIVHRRHLRPIGTYDSSNECAKEELDPEPNSEPTHSDDDEKEESITELESKKIPELRRSERLKTKTSNFKKYFSEIL